MRISDDVMNEKFKIIVGSIPTEEDLVCEIYYESTQWAQIYWNSGKCLIQLYSYEGQEYWEFQLEDAIEALESAKKKFLSYGQT